MSNIVASTTRTRLAWRKCFNIPRVWSTTATSAREPLGLSSEAEASFLRAYILSHPPKDSCWEVLTASIQINFPYRNDSLVQLIKQCLLWNHILIEIIAHRTSPTPQRRRSAESKWFIDFLFLFFPPAGNDQDKSLINERTETANGLSSIAHLVQTVTFCAVVFKLVDVWTAILGKSFGGNIKCHQISSCHKHSNHFCTCVFAS